jgi:HEAT repeat protein
MPFFVVRISLLLFAFGFLWTGQSEKIVRHQDSSAGLAQRWEKAVETAKQSSSQRGFWIGFNIERPMEEDSFVGNFPRNKNIPSLEEIVFGKSLTPEPIASSHNKHSQIVRKKIAILFNFEPETSQMVKAEVHNLSLSVDLRGRPLIWLGEAEDIESLTLLRQQFESTQAASVKEGLLSAVALHKNAEAVAAFFRRALSQSEEEAVRSKAAYWVSVKVDAWLDKPEDARIYLGLLLESALRDPSPQVREQTLSGIGQMDLSVATDMLIEMIRNEADGKVRTEAILWLAQRPSESVLSALQSFVNEGVDAGLQKQVVIGFWHMPNQRGIPSLIEIARTHPISEVRKEAIYWLQQSKDQRARDALNELPKAHDIN